MQEAVRGAVEAIPADRADRRWPRSQRTRALFVERERALQRSVPGRSGWREAKARFRNAIAHACRRDRREWVEATATEMQKAADRGIRRRCGAW